MSSFRVSVSLAVAGLVSLALLATAVRLDLRSAGDTSAPWRPPRPARWPIPVDAPRSVAARAAETSPPAATTSSSPCLLVQVTDAAGAPVAGADVAAYPWAATFQGTRWWGSAFIPPERAETPLALARAGVDGVAVVSGLPTGWFRVVARADGHAACDATAAWAQGDPPTRATISLQRGHELAGRVRDARGVPLVGVLIVAASPGNTFGPAREAFRFRTRSGPDGSWRITDLPAGEIEVWLRGDESFERNRIVFVPDIATVDLVAPATGVVRGRVTSAVTGAGVPGARVVAFEEDPYERREEVASAITDADGAYLLRVPNSSARIDAFDVESDGLVRTPDGRGAPMAPIDVRADADVTRDFVLRPDAHIDGIVRGPLGAVAGAIVRVGSTWNGEFRRPMWRETRSDAAGVWSVGGLPSGDVVVRAFADGLAQPGFEYEPTHWTTLREFDEYPDGVRATVEQGRVGHVDVTLVDAGTNARRRVVRSGVVRLADGAPAPHARVWIGCCIGNSWNDNVGETVADVAGRYRLACGVGGDYLRVFAELPGHEQTMTDPLPVEPESVERLDVRIGAQRPRVFGRATDAGGRPVAGARVVVGTKVRDRGDDVAWDQFAEATTALDGTYAFTFALDSLPDSVFGGSPTDDHVVCVIAEGLAPGISDPFELKAGERRVDVALDKGQTLTGRVVISETGAASTGSRILVGKRANWPTRWLGWPPEFPPSARESERAVTADDGSFRVECLGKATYRVEVVAPGFAHAEVDVAMPQSGDLVIRLNRKK